MPKFGRRSKERLKGVHPDLVKVVNDKGVTNSLPLFVSIVFT